MGTRGRGEVGATSGRRSEAKRLSSLFLAGCEGSPNGGGDFICLSMSICQIKATEIVMTYKGHPSLVSVVHCSRPTVLVFNTPADFDNRRSLFYPVSDGSRHGQVPRGSGTFELAHARVCCFNAVVGYTRELGTCRLGINDKSSTIWLVPSSTENPMGRGRGRGPTLCLSNPSCGSHVPCVS